MRGPREGWRTRAPCDLPPMPGLTQLRGLQPTDNEKRPDRNPVPPCSIRLTLLAVHPWSAARDKFTTRYEADRTLSSRTSTVNCCAGAGGVAGPAPHCQEVSFALPELRPPGDWRRATRRLQLPRVTKQLRCSGVRKIELVPRNSQSVP